MGLGEAMAKVYYGKDGSYPRNFVDLGRRVSVEVSERRLQGQDLRYLRSLPPEVKYVLIEVDLDEPRGRLLTPTGYYLVPQLSPDAAEALIFPQESP
jgi:hypothetical protein